MDGPLLIPMLVCRDAAAEIEFCKTAFGAEELSRRVDQAKHVVHATLSVGGALLMVHGEYPHLGSRAPRTDGSSGVVVYLYVDKVDAVIAQALRAGAKVLIPVANTFWGDRVGRIMDPAGHVWNVAARLNSATA